MLNKHVCCKKIQLEVNIELFLKSCIDEVRRVLNSKLVFKGFIDHVFFHLERTVNSSYHFYFQSGGGLKK